MARRKVEPVPAAENSSVKTVTVRSAPGLNLREAPAYDARVLRVLRDGETIGIDSGADAPAGWLPVEGGGYVMARYVRE